MAQKNSFTNVLPDYMVEPYLLWCKEQGLEPYNKYSITEWKKTEDYYALKTVGDGEPIDILHNEIEDDDDIDYPDTDDHLYSFTRRNGTFIKY